jgi:chromosome segregation ATPase
MVARCVPDSEDYENQSAYVRYDDYAALEQRFAEVQEINADFRARLKPSFDYVDGQVVAVAEDEIDRLEQRVKELEAERDKLNIAYNSEKDFRERTQTEREKLRAENERLQARLKEQAEQYQELIASLHRDIAELRRENKRLREVLQKISVWGCNGHCVDLCGSKCPCCLAEEALGGAE